MAMSDDELRAEIVDWLRRVEGLTIETSERRTAREAVYREFTSQGCFPGLDRFWFVMRALDQSPHEVSMDCWRWHPRPHLLDFHKRQQHSAEMKL